MTTHADRTTFRDELVAATARANRGRPAARRHLIALAALALIPTSVAAAAVSGLFSLPDGSTAERGRLSCTQHGSSFTISALAGPGDQRTAVHAQGRCPDLSGVRIISDPASRHIAPLYAHVSVDTDGLKHVVRFDVVGRASDGRDIVISITTPAHLGKTARQLGLTAPHSVQPSAGHGGGAQRLHGAATDG